MQNVHQKRVDALGNFSRRTKSYSKFSLSSIKSLFFFSTKLHQRSRLLYNFHCNSLLLSQNNENYMFCLDHGLDSSLHRLVGDFQEFCQITSRTFFPHFIHVLILLSFVYIFRLAFLRMRPQLTIRLIVLYEKIFCGRNVLRHFLPALSQNV